MSISRLIPKVFALGLVAFLFHPPLFAQTGGTITGRVFDQTGAVIPGVTVELFSGKLRTAQSTITGGDGRYRFDNVVEGPAELTFRLINFSTVRRAISVTAGSTSTADITLVVSSSADITVTTPRTFRNLAD